MSLTPVTTFVVWTSDFNWRIGGVYALHLLAHKLAERGYRVVCPCTTLLPHSAAQSVTMEMAKDLAQQPTTITVYPEIVPGNPLNAMYPVRWVLYYPGGHGSGDTVYASNECIVTYHDIFVSHTPYRGCPLVHLRASNVDTFRDLSLPRTGSGVLIKKGRHRTQSIQDRSDKYLAPFIESLELSPVVVMDDAIQQIPDMKMLNQLFNTWQYFISFDMETYYSVLAAMAGCISVIIPQDGLMKDELFSSLPDWKYGIAYGLDDVAHAVSSRVHLYAYAKDLERDNDASVNRLFDAIRHQFPVILV